MYLKRSKTQPLLCRSMVALPLLVGLAFILSAPSIRSQTSRPPANRFLFIYDISAPMDKHLAEVQKATREIIESRCSGQLHYGDTLGVWSFDAQLYTGLFPLEVWTPTQEDETLLRVQEFLKQQHGLKRSRLDPVMDGVSQVITGPQITTVILFSTGVLPMQGTPFDQEINDAYRRALKEMKRDRMPLVTVLQARNGKLLKYTVNALPWPAVIPELPIPIKSIAATRTQASDSENAQPPEQVNAPNNQSAPVPTNTTPAAQLAQTPSPQTLVLNPPNARPPLGNPSPSQPPQISPSAVPPPPQLAAAPPAAQGPNFDAKPPMPNPPAPAPSAPPSNQAAPSAPVVTQTPTVSQPPPPAPIASSTPAQLRSEPPPIKPVLSVAAVTRSNPAPVPAPTTVTHAAPQAAASTSPAQTPAPKVASKPTTNVPPVQTAVAIPSVGNRSKARLVTGIALLCVATILLFVTLRRFRSTGPSLITRSMGGLRK